MPSLSPLPHRTAPDGGVVSLLRDPQADVSHSCDVGGRETVRLRNCPQRIGAEKKRYILLYMTVLCKITCL